MSRKLFEQEEEALIAGINVTPLVDVVLVLLIIFMVTASFIVRETIEVQLPRAASGGETVGTTVNLVLDERGVLYLDGKEATLEEARRAVRELARQGDDARAIISADKRLAHGRVVEIIDLVKSEGLSRFAINIEKDSAASPGPCAATGYRSGGTGPPLCSPPFRCTQASASWLRPRRRGRDRYLRFRWSSKWWR